MATAEGSTGSASRCQGSRGDGLDLDTYDAATQTAVCPTCGQRMKLLHSGFFPRHDRGFVVLGAADSNPSSPALDRGHPEGLQESAASSTTNRRSR